MRPFSIYQSCKELFSHHQEQLLAIIKDIVQTDVVYLLGASLHRRRSESVFCPEAPTAQHVNGFYLLILVPSFNGKEQYEWQDQIEQRCSHLFSVTTIVLKTATFTEWAASGHLFAHAVLESAPLIYSDNGISFAVPSAPDPDLVAKANQEYYQTAIKRASAFLAGADLFTLRKEYPMAAFMLHQAAEQALQSLLKIGTGYHSYTHSLERLVRYAGMVSYELHDVFVSSREKDCQLLKLLQKAYSDTRYGTDYKITAEQLNGLTEKVDRILKISSNIVSSKLTNKI